MCSGIYILVPSNLRFENSVILYGSKTSSLLNQRKSLFENSVILYGSKTSPFVSMSQN